MQQMNPILKVNGVNQKMLGGRATTESVNSQDHPVQSASVALASTVCTSYQKTIMTQPQTRNSYRIDLRAGQQGSRDGMTVLSPDLDKFVTERNRRKLLKRKRTINLSSFNIRTL